MFNIKLTSIPLNGLFIVLLLINFSLCFIEDGYKRYNNYSVLRFKPTTTDQLHFLYQLAQNETFLMERSVDFWTEPGSLNSSVDIMLSPEARSTLSPVFASNQLTPSVMIEDVQSRIDAENLIKGRQSLPFPFGVRGSRPNAKQFFSTYQRYDTMMSMLDEIARSNSKVATIETIGKSFEGRDLKVIKISSGSSSGKKKIWIDAGLHAREWIGPSTAMYFINKLVTSVGKDENVDSILSKYDIVVLPLANPDGYEYTHTTNRMWRKTRSLTNSRWGYICRGADPNRNWSYKWRTGGSSTNPCSDVYAGSAPFSEPEPKAMSQYILKNGPWHMYISFHSYSQLILLPWGWTTDLPKDYKEMYRVAEKAATSLKSIYDTPYTVGSATNLLYVASGGSDDWAYGEAGVPYSYTFELRDTGDHGFVLPDDLITPTAEETFVAFKTMCDEIYPNK
ncbi:carboxypeptidase B-like [Panonychus citri]|uniref:carboxypeptidase B-like n=1 Tax=Panonychus citri TaxID=50023 RepID=UPI00230780E3|nr:carboxypeptidase B-like [Panonychus citri]